MYILWQLFIFALVTYRKTKATLQENETGEVIFVNVLHRHGDRTPASFYPTDPYQSKSYWPEGLGQLTNAGKKRVFELGQWLRRRYDSLLTEVYSSDSIYIQSTDKDRTLMSAQCNLAGMYPPKGAQVWSDDLAWQPIPVHTTPLSLDKVVNSFLPDKCKPWTRFIVLHDTRYKKSSIPSSAVTFSIPKVLAQPPRTPCPAYDQEIQRVFTTDETIRQMNQTYSELFRWTNENSGANFTLLTLYLVYDALFVESLYNLTLPEWTKSVFPEPMQEACLYSYRLVTWTPKLVRITTGLLLQEMIQNMVSKVQNTTTRNVHVYSAHDETITNILTALGAFNNILPPYATCLMMELRVDSGGKYYVSLYYRNSTTEPYLLTVEGCDPVCPLDKFISISQPLIPEDWNKECSVADEDHNSYLWIVLIVVAIVIVAILVTLALYYFYYRRKSH